MIPVARKVWQPILVVIPAALARRCTIAKASLRSKGRSDRILVLPFDARNSGPLGSPVDPGGLDIGVEVLLEGVVHRHLVMLAALLVQPEPPALALGEVVLDPHRNRRADPRKAVDQHPDQCPIAQADRVSVGMPSNSSCASSGDRIGVFPRLTTCFGPRTTEAGFNRTTWPTTSQS